MTAIVYKSQLWGNKTFIYKNLNIADWSAQSAMSNRILYNTIVMVTLILSDQLRQTVKHIGPPPLPRFDSRRFMPMVEKARYGMHTNCIYT